MDKNPPPVPPPLKSATGKVIREDNFKDMSIEELDTKLDNLTVKISDLENQRRKIAKNRPLNKKALKD
jgi:chaperonin cofactor prefoldin